VLALSRAGVAVPRPSHPTTSPPAFRVIRLRAWRLCFLLPSCRTWRPSLRRAHAHAETDSSANLTFFTSHLTRFLEGNCNPITEAFCERFLRKQEILRRALLRKLDHSTHIDGILKYTRTIATSQALSRVNAKLASITK
jgi:hypothetical protein